MDSRFFRVGVVLAFISPCVLAATARGTEDPAISIKSESASYTYLQNTRGGDIEVTSAMIQSNGRWVISQPIGENGVNGTVASSFEVKESAIPREGSIVALLRHVIDRTGGSGSVQTNGSAELALQVDNADEDTNPVVVDIYRAIIPYDGATGTVKFGEEEIEVTGTTWHRETHSYDAEDDIPVIAVDGKLTMTGTGKIEVLTTIVVTISGCPGNPEVSDSCETPVVGDDPVPPDTDCPAGSPDTGDALHLRMTTGNFWTHVPIFKTSNPEGEEFDFELRYDSLRAYQYAGLGYGWRHSYQYSFSHVGTSDVATFITGDGRRNLFTRVTFGASNTIMSWLPPMGRDIYLSWTDFNAVPHITRADNHHFNFEAYTGGYRLKNISDRHNRLTSFSYVTGTDRISTITSPYGRVVTLGYDGTKLSSIQDPNQETTTLSVTTGGLLEWITDPLGQGHTVSYIYDSNNRMTQETLKNAKVYKANYGTQQSTITRTLKAKNGGTDEVIAAVTCSDFPETDDGSITPGFVTIVDGRSHTSYIFRDNLGRLTTIDKWNEDLQSWDFKWFYYGVGEVAGFNRNRIITILNTLYQATQFTWTEDGQLDTRIDNEGNHESFIYDEGVSLVKTHSLPHQPGNTVSNWEYEYYSPSGDLKKVTDPENGSAHTIDYAYIYNETGLPGSLQKKTVTDRNGHQTKYEYTYNSTGYVETITRGAGTNQLNLVTVNEYDIMGRLTMETEYRTATDTTVTEHTYDEMSRLLNTTRYMSEAPDLVTQRHYDSHGNLDIMTNPRGVETVYEYDHRNRMWSETVDSVGLDLRTEYTIDGNDNVVQVKDPLLRTTYLVYNEQDQLVQSTDAAGYVTNFQRDIIGRVEKIERATSTNSSAPDFRSISYHYDDLNRVDYKTVAPGSLGLTTYYEYAPTGGCTCNPATPGRSLPHKITDPNERVTFLNYDKLDRLTKVVRKVGDQNDNPTGDTTDAVTQYIYDPEGNILHLKGPEDEDTEFAYDQADRRISKTVHYSSSGYFTTHFEQDGADNVVQMTLPNGTATYFAYDSADRLTSVDDGDLASFEYDENGNVLRRYDGLNHYWRFVYDAADRLQKAYDPLIESGTDKFTEYRYDAAGNKTLVINNKDIKTHFDYDNLDRLTVVKEDYHESTSSEPTANTITTYGYDGISQTSISDHDSNPTSYEYDHALRLKKITYPSPGGHVDYAYDAAGNLETRTDQRGVETTYGYDDLYHLTGRQYSWNTTRTESFAFDRSNRMTAATISNLMETTFGYDRAGRVTSAHQNYLSDSENYECQYEYIVDGCDYVARTITYPGTSNDPGRVVTHEMTERLNGVRAVYDGDLGTVASWSYDEADRRTATNLVNGVGTSFEYDVNNRLKNIQHAKDTTTLFDIDYGYDEVGNRMFKRFNSVNSTNDMTSRSEVYSYDNRDRLKQMERGAISSIWPEGEINYLNHSTLANSQIWYNLDPRGNWKDFRQYVGSPLNNPGVTRTTTVNGLNQYETIDPDGPASGSPTCTSGCTAALSTDHDDAGNMTLDPIAFAGAGLEFQYDEENRLTKVKRASDHAILQEITYDAIGRRIETIDYWDAASNSAMSTPRHTRHVFDGLQTIQEYACTTSSTCSSWTKAREFIWGDCQRFPEPVAMIDRTDAGNLNGAYDEPFYYLHDALGSVVGLTDSSGVLVERYTYDPYGKAFVERKNVNSWAINGASSGAPTYSAYGNPFMWTGQRYDAPLSLYHFVYRSYSPILGRWLQPDPMGYHDGINLFEYVTSEPLRRIDPLGLWLTEDHEWIIDGLDVDESTGAILKRASAYEDGFFGQFAGNAYKHSMRAPWQTAERAKQKRDEWMARNEQKAIAALDKGDSDLAAWYLGKNIHAIADSFSPPHGPWNVSLDPTDPRFLMWILEHVKEESSLSFQEKQRIVRAINAYLRSFRNRYCRGKKDCPEIRDLLKQKPRKDSDKKNNKKKDNGTTKKKCKKGE